MASPIEQNRKTGADLTPEEREEARETIRAFEGLRKAIDRTQNATAPLLDINPQSLRRHLVDPERNTWRPMPPRMMRLMRAFAFLKRKGLLEEFMAEEFPEERAPRKSKS